MSQEISAGAIASLLNQEEEPWKIDLTQPAAGNTITGQSNPGQSMSLDPMRLYNNYYQPKPNPRVPSIRTGGFANLMGSRQKTPMEVFEQGQSNRYSNPYDTAAYNSVKASPWFDAVEQALGTSILNVNPAWWISQTQPQLLSDMGEQQPEQQRYWGGYRGGGGSYSGSSYKTPRWFQDMMMWRI